MVVAYLNGFSIDLELYRLTILLAKFGDIVLNTSLLFGDNVKLPIRLTRHSRICTKTLILFKVILIYYSCISFHFIVNTSISIHNLEVNFVLVWRKLEALNFRISKAQTKREIFERFI